jgi:hypothetical protein
MSLLKHPRRQALLFLCAGLTAGSGEAKAPARFFSRASLFNQPIPAEAKLAPRSIKIRNQLIRVKTADEPLQLNRDLWTVNVSFAPVDAKRVSVTNADGWRVDGVPLGEDAFGTSDADGHLVIIDQEKNLVWNFYQARRKGDMLTAAAFGVFRLNGPGWWNPNGGSVPGPWSGRSSNASLLGGLIFPEELTAGEIPHALSLSMDVKFMAQKPALPALTTDDHGVPGGIPNGSRLQLDPRLDLDNLGLGREAKIIARAWQKFGAFIVERGTGIAIYFRSVQNLHGQNPYKGMDFTGLTGRLLQHTRVISPERSYEYDYPSRFNPPMPYLDASPASK